jgi:lysophospholipid acyltransferase (LPLAT)-like uncharacterized protein
LTDVLEMRAPAREQVVAPAPGGPALDFKTRCIVRLGTWVIFALGWTWRVRVFGREALLARAPEDPRVVMTLWHGQLLPAAWAHRQPAAALVSEHRDGEIISRIVGRMGVATVRGSSSRGGARALLECVTTLRQHKRDMVLTPDGPRGPRHSFAPGALIVAYRAGAPIIPLVVHADRLWRLKSWDQFEIPKPFARVTVYYGAPIPVLGEDVREISSRTDEFAAALNAAMAHVAMLARSV